MTALTSLKRLAVFIAIAYGVALPAASSATAAPRDTLTIGMTQFPSTFHPLIDAMLAKSYILAMTRRPVTTYDKDWKLVCLLCTKLPTIENGLAKPVDLPPGEDGKPRKGIALTVTLLPDLAWGDGTPVTTKDIIATWTIGRHPKTGVGNFEAFRRILKVEAKDERTFVMTIDRITFRYNDMSGLYILPAHLETAIFEDNPTEYRNRTTFDADTTNKGLYFGPYRIAEVVKGSFVTLVPNETWKGKKPHFKRIVVRVVENTAAMEANLRAGNIDYIAGELGLTIDQALAFERRNKGRYDFIYKAGLIYEHIDLNLDNPILKDVRVRRALIHAIDRETLVKQLFQGKQPVAHSSVSPLDKVADPNVKKYAFDPKRAAKLLDEAGWKRRGRFRANAKGERLTLEISTTAGNRSRELVQQVLQSYWRRVGIDVRIRNQPARVFFGQTMTQRRYTALGMYAWIASPENVPRTTLHSSQIPTRENNWAGQNYTGFRNKEMDALIDKIEIELDEKARMPMWAAIQRIYAEQAPVIPLYFRANAYIIPKWLKGIEPTGHQFPSTLWVENWRAE